MLRTSFIAMYKNLVFWAWPAFGRPLSKVAQQSSFQSLATPPASATGLWSEETSRKEEPPERRWKSAEGCWKQGVDGREKEETKDGEWNGWGIDLLFN